MSASRIVTQAVRAFIKDWLDMVDPYPELGEAIPVNYSKADWAGAITFTVDAISESSDLADLRRAAFMPSALPWASMPIEVMRPLYEKILDLGGRDAFVLETFSSYLLSRYKFQFDDEAKRMADEAYEIRNGK